MEIEGGCKLDESVKVSLRKEGGKIIVLIVSPLVNRNREAYSYDMSPSR